MRVFLAVLAPTLAFAACGGAPAVTGADPAPTTTETPAPATSAQTGTTSEVTDVTEAPTAAGPPAPDFSLVLSNGETFVLSEQAQPVYMVFWAEW